VTTYLRNATGKRLQGEYPFGGRYVVPPRARVVLRCPEDPQGAVEKALAERVPQQVAYLLSLGMVDERGPSPDIPEPPQPQFGEGGPPPPVDDPNDELARMETGDGAAD